MTRPRTCASEPGARLRYGLLIATVIVIWIVGGASRGDVFAQPVVRFLCTMLLALHVFFVSPPRVGVDRWPMVIAALSLVLVAAQLVPLPPGLWTHLPGRELLVGTSVVLDEQLPWRPLSVSPAWTVNSLGSLLAPATMLVVASGADRSMHERLLGVLMVLSVVAAVLGLVQLAGGHFDHPLINDSPDMVSGNFANRNHYALYMAISCVIVWHWAALRGAKAWRRLAAAGSTALFGLLVLATGSRAGLLLLLIAVAACLAQARGTIDYAYFKRHPRRAVAVGAAGLVALAAMAWFILVSDRAQSVTRIIAGDATEDIRVRLVPLTLELAARYFPFGSGFGTFDPVFRAAEPADMLSPLYYNRAHSDLVEVLLEGGLVAGCLLAGFLVWVGLVTWRAWRQDRGVPGRRFATTGTTIMILVIIASATDYPARTPLIMAIFVLAAIWTCQGWAVSDRPVGHIR